MVRAAATCLALASCIEPVGPSIVQAPPAETPSLTAEAFDAEPECCTPPSVDDATWSDCVDICAWARICTTWDDDDGCCEAGCATGDASAIACWGEAVRSVDWKGLHACERPEDACGMPPQIGVCLTDKMAMVTP